MNEEQVAIDPGTVLLIEALEKRWTNYRAELKRCKKEASEEPIHDLRVATRRLLALVDMLRELDPHPRLQKLRRELKTQLDSLDDLRDTQVMLVEVTETVADIPELASFQEYLTKREKRLLRSAAKAIRSFHSGNIRKRLDSTRNAFLRGGYGEDRSKELLQAVDEAYGTTVGRYRNIEPVKPATIHRVRIAFKKFRYMVELVYSLVPNFPDDNFKQMHDYQGLMGDIQDVEVFLSVFNEFAEKDSAYHPDSVRQYYQQRHSDVIHAFIEDMHQLNVFWRPGAAAPFPWEIKRGLERSEAAEEAPGITPDRDEDGKREQMEKEQETQK